MTSVAPVPNAPMRPILPSRGIARVKNVLSGDTVILLGKAATPDAKAPEVVFTLEKVSSPRIASKANANTDEGGAFPAREWLRKKCVGKSVSFETRKQGATAGDRVYGLLFMTNEEGQQVNLAVECVREGHATPKIYPAPANGGDEKEEEAPVDDPVKIYEQELTTAFEEAQREKRGIHADVPLVRNIRNAGDDIQTLELVEKVSKLTSKGSVKCVIEYIFDGSRYRLHVTDPELDELKYVSFTLLLGGVSAPRLGNPNLSPPTENEPFSGQARQFVEARLLQRELEISLHGTDKSGICAVGSVHHPRGNIAVELLKNGLARTSDWSIRMLNPADVPALRIAENGAKRTNTGVWHSYAPPELSGASELSGMVVEVVTGDTVSILPNGEDYDSEEKLKKISLASVRAPRVGNEKLGRADEPFSTECKERLRVLTVGKPVKVNVHYERDIPLGETSETRQFGTIAVGKRDDVGEVLVAEGLATTQRHRDDDERSPRYDELCAAEATAKAAKKGLHSEKEYKKKNAVDLSEPRKAKGYSGSLMRAGTLKAIVEYVFNGARFKMLIPSENCNIVFAPNYLRCPQPSPSPGSRITKPAEPFGDQSKRHARLTVLQRTVEIVCSGVTMGGVITGSMHVGQGGQRRDYSLELVGAGLATVDQRKIDYGEAPKSLVDAQLAAQSNKVGIWSLEQPKTVQAPKAATKHKETVASVRLSEICSGNHFFYRTVGDGSAKVIDESMQLFTKNNGTAGAPCDAKPGKVVAALFNDGNGKAWYRAKIVERGSGGRVKVLFIDHGNYAMVSITSQLRPLDMSLSVERIRPVATEAKLILTLTRGLDDDEGIDAARRLQSLAWGKDLSARVHCIDEGCSMVTLLDGNTNINESLVTSGLARVAKQAVVDSLMTKMVDGNSLIQIAADLNVAQEVARKSRTGMWRYGDVGEDDDDDM